MNFKRRMKKLWRMLLKKISQMSASTKRAIIVFIVGVILGGLLGNNIGQSIANKKADEEIARIESEWKAKNESDVATIQRELDEALSEEEVELPWYLVLVNDNHPMEEGYEPELAYLSEDRYVDERIVEAASEMINDAREAGLGIYIGSTYRSVEDQARIFNYSMEDRRAEGLSYWEAVKSVSLLVAEPGTSEHALGLALDLTSNVYVELDEGQENTAEAKWLKENCYKYGFILRYPPEKTDITGISYEPWHYRYVGVEDATKITELGITLEEYLEEYYHYE